MYSVVLKRAAAVLAGVLILLYCHTTLAETLTGRIRLTTPEGQVLLGTELRVLLATEKVFSPPPLADLPTVPGSDTSSSIGFISNFSRMWPVTRMSPAFWPEQRYPMTGGDSFFRV
jgi:hypothetical protein